MNGLLSGAVNLLIFAVMLGVLIFVHELGHFVVAKRLKVPVLEFGFGFPPRVWRFWKDHGWIEIQGRRIFVQRNFKLPDNLSVGAKVTYKTEMRDGRETLTSIAIMDDESAGLALTSPVQNYERGTEYTVNAIPLGGFVRLLGEEDPTVPGGFGTAKPWVRIAILVAGVTMNFILAYLVFIFAAMFSPPYAEVSTTQLAGIAPNSPAALADLRAGDIITAVNGQNVLETPSTLPIILRQNAGKQVILTVSRSGKTLDPVEIVPRVTPPQGEGPLGIALNVWVGLRVSSVASGSVADQAGVRAGDVLVFLVDPKGRALRDQNELAQFVREHPGWQVDWSLMRGTQMIGPVKIKIPDQVNAQNATLGVDVQTSVLNAPGVATQQLVQVALAIPDLFGRMLRGNVPANSFVGVIGIYQATGEVAQRGGPIALLQFLGLLSLNLSIVNLFPFPPLDGGQLLFVLLEWVRGGKKIDPKKQGMVQLIGAATLIGLMLIISYFDVLRWLSGAPILPAP